jgi:hypothetical protein
MQTSPHKDMLFWNWHLPVSVLHLKEDDYDNKSYMYWYRITGRSYLYLWHAWERNVYVQGFGGKVRRKETSWKTKA